MDWLTFKSWHVRREIRKWMRSAPEKAHILDAGTGFGHNAYWLSCQRDRFSVLAIDKEQSRVCSGNAFVRDSKRKNLLFRTMSISSFEESNAFDLILCTGELEKIEDDHGAISNLHQALRDGGLMITTVHRSYESGGSMPEGSVRNGYSMDELKALFRDSGFHHVKAHYTGGKAGKWSQMLGVGIPIKLLSITRVFLLVLPFYFIFTIPASILLNWLDSHTAHLSGEGILLLARK